MKRYLEAPLSGGSVLRSKPTPHLATTRYFRGAIKIIHSQPNAGAELSGRAVLWVGLEVLAVIFNLLFTFFYLRSNPWCYAFGIAGPLLFLLLCYRKQLYAEQLLQVVYVALAIYGLLALTPDWNKAGWAITTHLWLLLGGTLGTAASGLILKRFTRAKLPLLDSATTVFAIIATWVMMNYVHENWLYFIGVNTMSIFLYARRGMWIGATMFFIYLIMAIDGYFRLQWFYS